MTINSALTGDDITALKTQAYQSKIRLSFVPQASFATARINQSVFTKPLAQVTVDTTAGSWLSVIKGMTVWIGSSAGTHDIGIYRVRKTPTSTILYLAEMSSGDPGLLAQTTLKPLADNAYVTVILDHNLWSVFPRIDYNGGTTGTFYKDQDIAYSQQNNTGVAAILNLGEHRRGWVTAGVLTETFTPSLVAFTGQTISSRNWYVDGVSVSSSASLTYDFPTGYHLVRCRATLSNGVEIDAFRHVWAHHPTNYPPLEINITSDTRSRKGRRISVELQSAFDPDLREGAMCMVWEDIEWGSHEIDSVSDHVVGFASIQGSAKPGERNINLEITSPLMELEKRAGFSQLLSYASAPANWQEAIAALMHFDYFAFYLLYYHSTILSLFDFNLSGQSSYTSNVWKVDPGNIVSQINRTGSRRQVEITQTSDGALWLRRDPAMMSSSDRSSVTERLTLDDDLIESIDYPRGSTPEYAYVQGYGFSSGTGTPTPYSSQAAGRVGGQGAQSMNMESQLVASQSELNELTANKLAQVNNPLANITIIVSFSADVIEPALWYFLELDLPAGVFPEEEAANFRLIPLEVSISYPSEPDGSKTITLRCAAETIGYNISGETMPILIGNDMDDSVYPQPAFDDFGFPVLNFDPSFGFGAGYPTYYGLPALPSSGDASAGGGTPGSAEPPDPLIISWGLVDAGYIDDPSAGTPDWIEFFSQSGQGVRWMVWNQLSEFVLGTGNALQVWALTGNKLWETEDLISTPLTVKQGSLTGYYYILRNARGVPGGAALVGYGRASGTNGSAVVSGDSYVFYSPDGGDTVDETNLAGDAVGGVSGMDVDDFNLGIILTANVKALKYRVGYAGTGSFSTVTGLTQTGASSTFVRCIRVPYMQIGSASVLNNDATALHFILSIGNAVSTHYLFKCVLNTSTGVASETGITPSVTGTKYNVTNTNAGIEVYGGDGQRILMLGSPVDGTGNTTPGSTAKVFGSTDGGANWSVMSSPVVALHSVHFVEPEFGGDGLKAWFSGDGGIYYSDDFGATLTDKSGDFASDVSALNVRQMVAAIYGG